MIDLFDQLGNSLNDLIGSHENNNVGHAGVHLFASGGLASSDDLSDPQEGLSLSSVIRDTARAANQGVFNNSANPSMGDRITSYNSPLFLTGHLASAWGHFFRGPEPNPGGTNQPPQKPQAGKATQSENPTDFYARWYNRMREFAQAEEVSNRGQSQIRTR